MNAHFDARERRQITWHRRSSIFSFIHLSHLSRIIPLCTVIPGYGSLISFVSCVYVFEDGSVRVYGCVCVIVWCVLMYVHPCMHTTHVSVVVRPDLPQPTHGLKEEDTLGGILFLRL
jgi:hypothetical protein